MNKQQQINIDKTKGILIGYMIHLIQNETGGDLEVCPEMSEHAQGHADFMAKKGKLIGAPAHMLYSDELIGSITVPTSNLKVGLFNLVGRWFKYEANRERIKNAKKMGVGLGIKQNQDKATLFATKRMM